VVIVVVVVVDVADMNIIRFVAVDIIRNSAYHALPEPQSLFSARQANLPTRGSPEPPSPILFTAILGLLSV
jgi:hypothetical protein